MLRCTFVLLGLIAVVPRAVAQDAGSAAPAPTPAPAPAPAPAPTPAPATAAGATPSAAPDRELLDALTLMFDPWAASAQRQQALSQPAVRDPRAIPPLVFLLRDRDANVRAASARALGDFSGDTRVETALVALLQRRGEVLAVRTAAAEALSRQRGASAADALYAVYTDEREELALREAARKALEVGFPEVLAARGNAEVVDRQGRRMVTVGGAALGSFALASVGALGENNAGITIGALGGLVVGGGSAYLLTRKGEISRAQAAWMVSGTAWAAGLGMMTAGAVKTDPTTRYVLSLGLVGELAGAAATITTRKAMPYNEEDVYLINGGGFLGLDLAWGLRNLSETIDSKTDYRFLIGGGLVGLGAGAALAPPLDFSFGDRVLTLEGGYEGLFTGLVLPIALGTQSSRKRQASAYLGAGLGVAAGVAVAQFTDPAPGDVAAAWVIGSYGKLAGLSIPLLANASEAGAARGTLIGSTAALTASYFVAPRLQIRNGDAALVAVGTGVGLWHGLAFGASTPSLSSDQATGLTLLGLSVGGLGALGASQYLDLSNSEVLALGGGAFWGTWFTTWATVLATKAPDEPDLRWSPIASDLGLVAGALLIRRFDPRRIAVANLGGLAGAGLASLGAALATTDNDKVIGANLIGSAVGLLGGALLAASLNFAPATSSTAVTRKMSWPLPTLEPLVLTSSDKPPAVGLSLTFTER